MNAATAKQQLVNGVLWMTLVRALSQVITWFITIFVVRLLTPQDYGLMSMAVLVGGFLILFHEIGLGVAIIQRADLRDDQLSNLRWVILAVNLLFFFALLLSAPAVAVYLREPRLVPLVRVLAAIFVVQGIGAPSGYLLQRRMAFRDKAMSELAGHVAGGLATLTFALAGGAVWSLVIGYLAQHLATNVLYCVRAPFPLRFSFSPRGLREYLGFGGQVALSRILWYFASTVDSLIIGRMLGSVQLGFYGLAFQFSSLPIDRLVTIISQVAFPSFSSLQHDDATLRRYFLKLTSMVAFTTFPILIGLALVSDAGVQLFLTSKWLPIVVPLRILCVVSCFRAVEMLCHPLAVAKGQPHISTLNGLWQAIVLPIAFYVGVNYGLQGVALAWLFTRPLFFAYVVGATAGTIQLRVAAYLNSLRHPVAGCLLMTLVVVVLRQMLDNAPLAINLVLSCASGCAVYLGYNWRFNREALQEALDVIRAWRARSGPAVGNAKEATAAL